MYNCLFYLIYSIPSWMFFLTALERMYVALDWLHYNYCIVLLDIHIFPGFFDSLNRVGKFSNEELEEDTSNSVFFSLFSYWVWREHSLLMVDHILLHFDTSLKILLQFLLSHLLIRCIHPWLRGRKENYHFVCPISYWSSYGQQ